MIRAILISFTALLAITTVSGYSGGAPVEVCDDMTPKHPVDPQKSSFPYTVTVSQSEVKAGEKVQITINGAKEKSFKGFLLEVRSGDKAVGSFSIPDTDKYAKGIDCHGTKQVSLCFR
ncbi:hypothetical protein ILUMI_01851 [Ignelater luminosus]|uniref:Reelin domain-containing protein n=1 Tax=Ignelater luminosus TaxID=2038154 RepID=A0A8K0DJF5_IGNLU|nr:hypothetical protein ILUMI_01851 [Ignelater luminosus]